ncbi:MAG TPA: YIP1 family protein [Terriglobia bacterium]|nr:YIP1 family protein [Terriglobia bacterium]
MGETTIAPPTPEEQPADSFLSRALGIFISPGQAFESIVRRPDFLAPLIVSIVGSIVMIEAMLEKIGAARIVRQSLELGGQAAKMTPDQVDQAVAKGATITAIFMRVAGVLGAPIFLLVIAAVGLFIVNVLFGASANFKTCFSVVCYANLVLLVEVVLGVVVVLMGDPEQFNLNNPIPTTVGFFLNPRETSKPLYVIASSFDVFRVWALVLCSIGLSAATGKKVGTVPIFLTYLGIWIVLVLGHAGIAAMMG